MTFHLRHVPVRPPAWHVRPPVWRPRPASIILAALLWLPLLAWVLIGCTP